MKRYYCRVNIGYDEATFTIDAETKEEAIGDVNRLYPDTYGKSIEVEELESLPGVVIKEGKE